jgi:hypothetical protein
MRGIARAAVALPLLSAACVFPRFDVSGAEMSWFMAESNQADGEEESRIRSCDGSLVTTVEVRISDDQDDDRTKQFTWTCAEGYRTPAQFFTGASDVFVELRPGNYRMTVRSVDDPSARDEEGETLTVSEQAEIVSIGSEDATLIQWTLLPQPVDLQVELAGTDTCETVSMQLSYADAAAALPDLEDDAEDPLPYRTMLESEGGLSLDASDLDCATLEDGADLFEGVDRGVYVLDVSVDGGNNCPVDVVVDGRQPALALDLGQLPC